jgi:tetratricopeptide (TPR) repeat protein
LAQLETDFRENLSEAMELLAHHSQRGELWGKAVTYHRLAGAKAYARSAAREARVYYEQALEILESLPESQTKLEQAFEIRLELRPVLNQLGDPRQMLVRLREAETLAERLMDDHRRGRVCALVTIAHSQLGELDEALGFGTRALRIAGDLEDLRLRILATTYLELVHYYRGEYESVVELATANLEALPEAWIYESLGASAPSSVYDRSWLIQSLAQVGRFAEAIICESEALRLAEPTHHPFTIGQAHRAAVTLHLLKGDWANARSLSEHWIARMRAGNVVIQLPWAISSSAWVLAQLGETSAAQDRLQEGEQLLERHVARELVVTAGWDYHSLGRACLALGRLEEAQRLGNHAVEFSPHQPGYAAHGLHLLGDIAIHPDRFDAVCGEANYRKALILAETRAMRPLVAHCHLGLGKIYRQTGNHQEASERLTTAATMYREMEMGFWLQQAEVERVALA